MSLSLPPALKEFFLLLFITKTFIQEMSKIKGYFSIAEKLGLYYNYLPLTFMYFLCNLKQITS